MKVIVTQPDAPPPVLPEATAVTLTDTVVVNQSGTPRTATVLQVWEAVMAVDLTTTGLSVGTTYEDAIAAPTGGTPRMALAIKNASSGATVYVFPGTDDPSNDANSWPLGPNETWPPAGMTQVSQDTIWLRATEASTPVIIMVG